MNWRDRPVLVTGATGLLGRHICDALHRREANVVAIVRDGLPRLPWYVRLPTRVRGDVTDQALVERTLAEYDIKTVFHLAAQTQVTVANKSPVGTFDSNIRGTWSVLEACRRVNVEQIIVASSDKAYGEAEVLPYSEATPLDPVYPYDVSKACADLIARSYAMLYEMPVAITRCGNLFGPGDLNWQRLIPGTIRSLLRNLPPAIRSNGTPRRDYFYVEDAAEAYLLLAEKLSPDLYGTAFNFSPGEPQTVSEMLDRILLAVGVRNEDIFGFGGFTDFDEMRGEIQDQYLDSTKARNLLGWAPKWTLDDALAKTVKWYRNYLGVPDEVA